MYDKIEECMKTEQGVTSITYHYAYDIIQHLSLKNLLTSKIKKYKC